MKFRTYQLPWPVRIAVLGGALIQLLILQCSLLSVRPHVPMENLLYEPEGPHNGYTLFLRTENVRVWNAYIDLTGNLTRAGYRVYLESSWGHHRGSRIFYGHPDCLSVLKEVRKIIGQHLSFEEMQVDSLLQLDRSYGLKEIIIQAEKSVLFSD